MDACRESLNDLSGPVAGGVGLLGIRQVGNARVPAVGELPRQHLVELRSRLRKLGPVDGQARPPCFLHALAPADTRVPMLTHGGVDPEGLEGRISEILLGGFDLILPQG